MQPYEFRRAGRGVCCTTTRDEDGAIDFAALCPTCRANARKWGMKERRAARSIATMRAACEKGVCRTPTSTRTKPSSPPATLTAAEVASHEPPNPWARAGEKAPQAVRHEPMRDLVDLPEIPAEELARHTPPDPWAPPTSKLRAAARRPAPSLLHALGLEGLISLPETEGDLASFEPPNPWAVAGSAR